MSRESNEINKNNDKNKEKSDKESKDSLDEEKRKIEGYDARLYNQQQRQIHENLPVQQTPNQIQHRAPPRYFLHLSFPTRYGTNVIPPTPLKSYPHSAPLSYIQSQSNSSPFHPNHRSISFGNYPSNVYTSSTNSNPTIINLPQRLQPDLRSMSTDLAQLRSFTPTDSSGITPHPQSISQSHMTTIAPPTEYPHQPPLQHTLSNPATKFTQLPPLPPLMTPYYPARPLPPPLQQQHPQHQQQQPPPPQPQQQQLPPTFIPVHPQQMMIPVPPMAYQPHQYPEYIDHNLYLDPQVGTPQQQQQSPLPSISFVSTQPKVVPRDSILPIVANISNNDNTKEQILRGSGSSSDYSDNNEENLIKNQIYGEPYLNSLMKDLKAKIQHLSDTNFARLCYLLEIDCCATKSNGSEPFICDPLDSLLVTNFLNFTAPWLDVYCSAPIFSTYLPHISLCEESSMMFNCILSCGALYLHRDDPKKFDLKFALKYYTSALKLLGMKILQNDRILSRCLICSILLNHYEDFAGDVQNKFNHHTGSRIILQEILNIESNYKKRKTKLSYSKQIDLSKLNSLEHNEFLESAFWVITNNDLQELLKWEKPSRWPLQNPNTTILSLSLNPDYDEKISDYISNYFDIDFKRADDEFFQRKDELWWLRKSAYNLQLIHDYCYQPYIISHEEYQNSLMIQRWIELKKMNDIYGKYIPSSLRRLVYVNDFEKSEFPQIDFKNTDAAIINLNYHLSCLLLYSSLIRRSGLFSPIEEEVHKLTKVLNEVDREFLSNKKNIKNLIRQHAISIIGIIKTHDEDNIVWSLNLGHFKIAFNLLKKYDAYHKDLDSFVLKVQQHTRTRFNRV